ncbi:zinc-binding alcohol dehydrogenase family protein [Rhodococcus oryzae]|uniref:quinone oxidoreductase family protein n=1 Tax=Rhodococcus oryzae TaxID=2571143 RepID=UPI00371A76CA
MRAIVMTSVGGPEVLVERDVPAPQPGAGEVVIRAEAIGVHFAETQLRSGIFPSPAVPPFVFGGEAAGTVVEVGGGVDRGMIGARVIATTDGTGAYAERVVAAAAATVRVPEGLSLTDAVAVSVPGAVALTLLRAADLRGGEVVLVEAAATGVGAYLTQLAGEFGAARILATAGTADKRDRARSFGACDVIDHADPDWPGRVREVLGDATIDVAFESIGGESAARLLDLMTPLEGRMLFYGLLSGRPAAIGSTDLMPRGLTLTGCGGPAWLGRVAAARAEILERAAAGTVTPVVDSILPLGDAALAHERIEKRAATGKMILAPTVSASASN